MCARPAPRALTRKRRGHAARVAQFDDPCDHRDCALGIPAIFGGAIITENVFKVNGIGQLLLTALFANDIPMVMTLTFIFAILIVLFNLIADVLYGVLDPRIRYD